MIGVVVLSVSSTVGCGVFVGEGVVTDVVATGEIGSVSAGGAVSPEQAVIKRDRMTAPTIKNRRIVITNSPIVVH